MVLVVVHSCVCLKLGLRAAYRPVFTAPRLLQGAPGGVPVVESDVAMKAWGRDICRDMTPDSPVGTAPVSLVDAPVLQLVGRSVTAVEIDMVCLASLLFVGAAPGLLLTWPAVYPVA
mmetsp:Transcript_35172/g.56544  ORF Transcript_35172/g.56544 Transcript_35172/m.56544 type:complete len:117 (-) Transcript_35172:911-1261(-)